MCLSSPALDSKVIFKSMIGPDVYVKRTSQLFDEILEVKVLTGILQPILLQLFCKIILCFQVIFDSIEDPDVSFKSNYSLMG